MPNPSGSDLHVNVPLTNVSVAFINRQPTIADVIFPNVPVRQRSNKFWVYDRADWRRIEARLRAPATESVGGGWRLRTDTFFADVYAVHKDIADQDRANADTIFAMDRDATEWVTQQLLLKRDKDFTDAYFQPGVWGHDRGGVAGAVGANQFLQWDQAGSNPITDFQAPALNMARLTGYRPNVGVFSPEVYDVLRNHSTILERIKYTQRGVITADLLASFFELDRFVVNFTTHNTAPEYQDQDANENNANYQFMAGKHVLLAYAAPSAGLQQPSAGYIFSWTGYLANTQQGIAISRMRNDLTRSDRIEGEMAYDMKVIAPDLGAFFANAVA